MVLGEGGGGVGVSVCLLLLWVGAVGQAVYPWSFGGEPVGRASSGGLLEPLLVSTSL